MNQEFKQHQHIEEEEIKQSSQVQPQQNHNNFQQPNQTYPQYSNSGLDQQNQGNLSGRNTSGHRRVVDANNQQEQQNLALDGANGQQMNNSHQHDNQHQRYQGHQNQHQRGRGGDHHYKQEYRPKYNQYNNNNYQQDGNTNQYRGGRGRGDHHNQHHNQTNFQNQQNPRNHYQHQPQYHNNNQFYQQQQPGLVLTQEQQSIVDQISTVVNQVNGASQVFIQGTQIQQSENISLNIGAQPFQAKQFIPAVKNKQDDAIRGFKNDIGRFLKYGRGWFPNKLPQSISKLLQKQCPETGALKLTKNCLRVMSYNVLATTLTGHFEYGCDPEFIKQENRVPLIRKEIAFLNPDILCLQETEDHTSLHDYLINDLKYEGQFLKKDDPTKHDGCATFYSTEKYIMIQKFEVHMGANKYSELYQKPQVQLILALQPVDFPDRVLLISNTHLYFNINRGDVKMAQLKMTTDTISQLRDYYQQVLKKKVQIVMCGDYNAGPRSGVYDFMRNGEYDCLKLSRNTISGQYHGSFNYKDGITSSTLQRTCYNIDVVATMNDSNRIAEWFTEINYTQPKLIFDNDGQPLKFILETILPFEQIDMKRKRPQAQACRELQDMMEQEIHQLKQKGFSMKQILLDKDRKFFKLLNNCGSFKSAYAQNLLNHVHFLNQIKDDTFPLEYLDIYSKRPEENILSELIIEGGGSGIDPLGFYQPDKDEVYGCYKWLKPNLDLREWLKRMSIMTKEPCFTSYTNIKLPVDYIFYQGEGMEVVRVLDLPQFSKYLKDNISCLPHPLMPSDHFSLVADFLIQ
eukprot:403331830